MVSTPVVSTPVVTSTLVVSTLVVSTLVASTLVASTPVVTSDARGLDARGLDARGHVGARSVRVIFRRLGIFRLGNPTDAVGGVSYPTYKTQTRACNPTDAVGGLFTALRWVNDPPTASVGLSSLDSIFRLI
ncbi:MAG TPA: hypothetical protein VFY61_17520 [Pyrinomonadaceae bacterium]|nr:hypothetical protein [Pyrinomonadaceae bacterium]